LKENTSPENLKTENLLTENLITECYNKENEEELNNNIVGSRRNYNQNYLNEDFYDSCFSKINYQIYDNYLNDDSVMIVNQQNKMVNEIIHKKRRLAQHKKYELNTDNAKIKKLFKKRDDDEDDKGKCTRCLIL
jgi:hypothetical protein